MALQGLQCARPGERQGILDAAAVAEFIAELRFLPIAVDPRFAQVFSAVRMLAVTHRLTAYDAAYLETAQRHRLPLATLDDELIRASQAAGVAIFETGVDTGRAAIWGDRPRGLRASLSVHRT